MTPNTVAYQAPPSMGFSRQVCWSGLPFPSPGDLPDPGIKPKSPALQADALLSEPSPGVCSNSCPFDGLFQTVKHLPAMRETWVRFLGREDTLEKEMATHSSTFAWKIPWTEEPGMLQSVGLQRVGHD